MEFGLILPTNEIGEDPDVLAEFARRAEQAGFSYLAIFDHVVGADVSGRPDWAGPYTAEHAFHEPFVVLAYLAAHCRLELMPAAGRTARGHASVVDAAQCELCR